MKTLYLECAMGAAGDMLTAALLELMPDRAQAIAALNAIGVPEAEFVAEQTRKCGIAATHIAVKLHGEEGEPHTHGDHGDHDHTHDHGHADHDHDDHANHDHGDHIHTDGRSMAEIEHLIAHLNLTDRVKADVLAVYRLIADAESTVHGTAVSEIHFHEVGTLDAVADIAAVCYLLDQLGAEQILASPIHVGCGEVSCAHGILPVPAPATALLLQGIPIYGGAVRGELCTPTGAALLKHFAAQFTELPPMTVEKIGYGGGKKDFERANVVRALLGETADVAERVSEFLCNLDDMTPEELGFASELLLSAGALDVYTVPVTMKKSRPGVLLCVVAAQSTRDTLLSLIFKHTTTLGVRERVCNRHTLARSVRTVSTAYGEVHEKRAHGYGTEKAKLEYEDLAALARAQGCSLFELRQKISRDTDR